MRCVFCDKENPEVVAKVKAGVDFTGISTPFYCHDGNGRWLFHKRSVKCRDEQGTWDTGAGRLEFCSRPEESVLREIREEYGCEGIIDEALPHYSLVREVEGSASHWVAFPFIVRVNPAEVSNNDPEYVDEIGWFSLDALPTPLHKGIHVALKEYRTHLEKYSVKKF